MPKTLKTKTTKSSLRALTNYIIEKELPALCDTSDDDLPDLLLNFYRHEDCKKQRTLQYLNIKQYEKQS